MKEPKKWIEVALMPIVVALVGIMGTYLITNEQREAAKIRADADRQVKILEIFANKLMSSKKEEKLVAASMTMAMDRDLATKMAVVFDMISNAEDEIKSSNIIEDFENNLISHAIISKLAEGKTGLEYQKAILEGRWILFRQTDNRAVNFLEFRGGEAGITVHGKSWDGKVTFDGKHGYYRWEFTQGYLKGCEGRTDFYLDSTGVLFGKVKGEQYSGENEKKCGREVGLEWTFWGIRGERST